MNGNPNAAQKRFHNDLREMYYQKYGGRGELHHVFGSKWNCEVWTGDIENPKKVAKPGEWIVILLTPEVHHDIKNYSFEAERGLFLEQLRDYKEYFGRDPEIPEELVEHYKSMISKLCTSKKVNKF